MTTATPRSARDLNVDANRLARLPAAIRADIAAAKFDGAVVLVARHGEVLLHEAIGFADRAAGRALDTDSVFTTFSILKQPTNATVLQKIDRGDIAFTTQVREVIPEYAQKGKATTTVADLLLHQAGLPHFPPLPPEQFGDIQAAAAAACRLAPQAVPGAVISYSAMLGHSVLAEIVRRIDGGERTFGQIISDDVFAPLGMHDTSFGSRSDLVDRAVPVVSRDRQSGLFDAEILEGLGAMMMIDGFEMPAGGGWTTASDWFRFAEACRRGGELDGVRILSPAVLRFATTVATGNLPNSLWDYSRDMRGWREFPAYLAPGFYVRGEGIFPSAFGTLASPSTFGGIGAGSNCFWIDPDSDLTYVFLSAGLMEDSYSWERHQRYADLVHSAVDR